MVQTSRAARGRVRARRIRRRLLVGCSVLLVFMVVLTTAGYGYVHYRFGQIRSVKVPGLRKASSGRPMNLLVVGSVPIAGSGAQNRINAAFAAGPGQLVQTIEQNFGIPINHYVLIDFDGFRAIVDALDGIDVRFPYPARDPLSGLNVAEPGCIHLNGSRALALARSRHFTYAKGGVWRSDPLADLGRIRRQHAFLQALVEAALAKGLTNPVRANAFIGSLIHEVTKDSALKVRDVIRLAASFRSFKPSKLTSYTLPVAVPSGDHPLGDILVPKQPDAERTVDRFLGRTPSATTGKAAGDATLTVLNALGTDGLAAATATRLRRSGYRIATVGNAPAADWTRSQVRYPPGHLADAKSLASTLVGGAGLAEDSTLSGSSLTLVLGPGFSGIRVPTATTPATPKPTGTKPRPAPPRCARRRARCPPGRPARPSRSRRTAGGRRPAWPRAPAAASPPPRGSGRSASGPGGRGS